MIEQVGDLIFYQRGGVPYDQAWNMSPKECEVLMGQAKKRFQSTLDSRIPMH